MEPTTFPAGTVLFEKDDEADAAYLVQDGRVEISIGDDILTIVERGTLFGEMALINDKPRAATARTQTETTCIVVPKSVFNSTLKNTDAFTRALIESLIRHVRAGHERLEGIKAASETESDVQFFMPQNDGSYRKEQF